MAGTLSDLPTTIGGQQLDVQTAPTAAADLNVATTPAMRTIPEGTKAPPASGGRDQLPQIAYSVEGVESDHHHIDPKTGQILTSSAGALGKMQLMPGTAKDLGVDAYDEKQNVEGGKRLLGSLYDKYGNWSDALAAYNAGDHRVDMWISAGRPTTGSGALPAETQRYVPIVLAGVGQRPSDGFMASKGAGDVADLPDHVAPIPEERKTAQQQTDIIKPEADEDPVKDALVDPESGTIIGYSHEMGEQRSATLVGVRRGLQNMILGPTQAVLEKVAPGAAKELTDKVNQMEEPYNDLVSRHGVAAFGGELAGTTASLLASGGLLGAAKVGVVLDRVVPAFIRGLSATQKAVAGGAALGATSWNENPKDANRFAEGAFGAAFGLLGASAAKLVGTAMRVAQTNETLRGTLDWLKQNYSSLEPSTSGIKEAMLARYNQLDAIKTRLYNATKGAGGGYATGLETGGGISKVINDSINATKQAGVAPTPTTQAVAREVERNLGLDTQRAAQLQARIAEEQHQQAILEWNQQPAIRALEGLNKPGTEALYQQNLRSMQDQGVLNARPIPPAPFQSEPIKPEQMAQARRTINRALRRSNEPATRTQIGIIRNALNDEAARAASAAGVPVVEFERRMAVADKFMKDKIGPFRDWFGQGATPQQLEQRLTGADVYDEVMKVVGGNDRESQKQFGELLGKAGREKAADAVLHQIVSKATDLNGNVDPKQIARTVRQWEGGLRQILQRDQFDRLVGASKIAENLAGEIKTRPLRGFLQHHPFFVAYGAMKLLEGHIQAGLVDTIGMPLAMEIIGNFARQGLLNGRMSVLLQRASKLGDVDGKQMQEIVSSLERGLKVGGQGLARDVPQETGGEPVTTGVEAGQAIAGGVGSAMSFAFPR
jgi:Transglycosylase SLT domain